MPDTRPVAETGFSHRLTAYKIVGSFSVTAMLDFSGKANTSIHGLGEDDTPGPTRDSGVARNYFRHWNVDKIQYGLQVCKVRL